MRAQPQNKKKAPLIVTTIVAAVLVGYSALAYTQSYWPFHSANDATDAADAPNTVNYESPTEQEVKDGQDGKKDTYNNPNEPDTNEPSGSKKSVDVGIAYADIYENNLEIRAFTNGVVQAGTCTATITKGNLTITESSEAFIDASSTQCTPMLIPKSKFSSGTWSVKVTYSSAKAEGTSEIIEVSIP